jgi:predicted DNA-binding transcriptional regulator AlpA
MVPAKVPSKRHSLLPPTLAPRGLSGPQAAAYIGVSYTKFLELVKDGRMPKPKRIDGRVVWDRLELDAAFAALTGDEESEANPWDEFLNAA